MPEGNQATPTAAPHSGGNPPRGKELDSLVSGSRGETVRQRLAKPATIVAIILGASILGLVIFLQHGPSSLTLELPEATYELLPNNGLVEGVPIAIHLGPLTLFQLSDPMAGGAGASRARQIVENLNSAVLELKESPGRVITIESEPDEGMPRIVQKEAPDEPDSLEIVRVTDGDMALMSTDNAKLLARVWAERLTDSMKLLVFGEPPEFSRDTEFGAALDALYGNATREGSGLTSALLATTFGELSPDQRRALTSFPPLPSVADSPRDGIEGGATASGS